jgi:hypothetical protein
VLEAVMQKSKLQKQTPTKQNGWQRKDHSNNVLERRDGGLCGE